MDEFARLMDWDLQAIVRGCTSEAPEATIIDIPHPNFPHFCSEQDHVDLLCSNFPKFSDTITVLDELAELYKPFYPVLHPLSTQTLPTTSVPIPKEVKAKEELQDLQNPAVPKCKKSKKIQNNRVVKQLTADGLCDPWAWRKYGQKPIKGSPYPRSYYRCSSAKGCLARKQVERSHLDPGVFIVTYTAEHSHHHPPRTTRKNRHLFTPDITQHTSSPLEDSIEDGLAPSRQSQYLNTDQNVLELSQDAEASETVTASDDWFPSLEELDELGQEFALDGCLQG